MRRLDHYWQDNNPVALLLLPLSWVFCALVWLRRLCYRRGWLQSVRLPVPVIVVGNVTVGGSGKTPLVIWLAQLLQQQGLRPGIVSRGYGGSAAKWPQAVTAESDPRLVGDEPVLIARRSQCPMMVGPDRVAAATALLEQVDVIISDDGMQHYRLRRDVEIEVSDAGRGYGNGHCLPAGPLREPVRRARECAFRIRTGDGMDTGQGYSMQLQATLVSNLRTGEQRALESFKGQVVHAVAGIGNPARFFATLRRVGIEPIEHSMPDHHTFQPDDLAFADDTTILMTEKDAVKCSAFGDVRMWAVAVEAELPQAFGHALLQHLSKR